MRMRFFQTEDAKRVLKWIHSEREFRMWSVDQYGDYPIDPAEIVRNYMLRISIGEFYPLIFTENRKIVGHLILRYPTEDKHLVQLGFIIVNDKLRRKGYGSRMIMSAIHFANKELGATKFRLEVITCNEQAKKCYEKLGFEPASVKKGAYNFHGEEWDYQEMIYDPAKRIVKMVKDNIINVIA